MFTISSVFCLDEYTGAGDDVIIIQKPTEDMPAILMISGNYNKRHFSITSYDKNNSYIELIVNTTEQYTGLVPIDLPNNTITKFLEISANGSWKIQVFPIGACPRIKIGEPFSGKGDYLLWVEGSASLASISGNSSKRHFSVIAYDGYGGYNGLMVNTTESYTGKVRVPKNTLLLKISAIGDWSITLQ